MADEQQTPFVMFAEGYPEIQWRLQRGWVMEIGWVSDRNRLGIRPESAGYQTGIIMFVLTGGMAVILRFTQWQI